MILRYIPNALSIMRLLLIVPFLIFLYQRQYNLAFYTFIFAGLSDGLDGWMARRFQWQSTFGSMIDPVADKILVMSSFISLGLIGLLPWWLISLVIIRDFTISSGVLVWHFYIQRHMDFEPTKISKINTIFQIILVTICLFELAYYQFPSLVINTLIVLTTFTTTVSFIDYVWTWGNKAWLQHQSHQ